MLVCRYGVNLVRSQQSSFAHSFNDDHSSNARSLHARRCPGRVKTLGETPIFEPHTRKEVTHTETARDKLPEIGWLVGGILGVARAYLRGPAGTKDADAKTL